MKARHLKLFAALLVTFALIGCDSGQKAPPKTRVHVVNAAPGFGQLWYQREHSTLEAQDALAFKAVTAHDYDVDTYDFFVYQKRIATQEVLNTWTWIKELVADSEYTFVLAQSGGQVSPQVVAYSPKFANSSDTQIAVVHAGENLPAFDVYVQPTGTGIGGAAPRGTVSFLGQISPKTFASADYEITLTAAGDPNNVLFTSNPVNLAAGVTNVFVIVGEEGQGTAPLSVIMSQDNPFVLFSANATTSARALNAADDGAARDFAVNHEYSPPILPAIPFGTVTSYVNVPVAASLPITVTPAGNPGVLELDAQLVAPIGTLSTVMFDGPAGTLLSQVVTDDRRRVRSEAKVRFFNAASQFTTVTEMVLLPPNTADQTLFLATTGLGAGAVTDYMYLQPGTYDLLFRETVTNTVRAGPTSVTLAEGGIYGILLLNGPDTATATVVSIDDPL